jgi:hypothetical protein
MNNPLRQSTAVTVKLGPFMDNTGALLATLTIAQANILLSKNGGAFAAAHNSAGATYDAHGYYNIPLDATDANALGLLRVMVDMSASGALAVHRDLTVLPAGVYDSLVAGTASLLTTAATVSDKIGYALTAAYDAAKTAAQPGDVPTGNQIADAVLARNVASAEGAAPRTSLATTILAMTNKANTFDHAGYLTVYRTDGVTEHTRIRLSANHDADPIDGVG